MLTAGKFLQTLLDSPPPECILEAHDSLANVTAIEVPGSAPTEEFANEIMAGKDVPTNAGVVRHHRSGSS